MKQKTATTRVGVGLSTSESAWAAAVEAAREAKEGLAGRDADLAFLFLSPQLLGDASAAAAALGEELAPRHLLGCVAEGVLGHGRELEEGPATAVWAASLPGARIETFHLSAEAESSLPDDAGVVIVLADPFTFPIGRLLDRHAGLPLVGGAASGGGRPGLQALVVDGELHQEGAAGVAVSGVPVLTLVSQGCAPFGREAVITVAEDNVVHELAGQPALQRLREELAALTPEQRLLASQGVLAGLVIDENKAEYGRGDYLMRGLMGIDEDRGGIAIGDRVRVGQTLRFHYRDAASADADLRAALGDALRGESIAGALLFTCNGRGRAMFGEPDHDARLVSELAGTPSVAGFFCGGEIGPVGGRVFLHGFTATLALFP